MAAREIMSSALPTLEQEPAAPPPLSSSSSDRDDPKVLDEKSVHLEGQHVPEGEMIDHAPLAGVAKVEALYKVFGIGRGTLGVWFLYLSVGLGCYILSLDSSTTSQYLVYATSAFDKHALLGSIAVAEGILSAVAKPFIARVSDITSRPTAYLLSLAFYLLGYIIIASAQNVAAVATGSLLIEVGNAGLDVCGDIIVADVSTLEWRGLATALLSAPYLINFAVSAEIANAILTKASWRWGYGMFAILVPAALAPTILILYIAQNRAAKLHVLTIAAPPAAQRRAKAGIDEPTPSYRQQVWAFCVQIDFVGLWLLAAAFALILLPFTLYKKQDDGWASPPMIVMLVLGVLLLPAFYVWESRFATVPLMPSRIVYNRAFQGAVLIDVTYMMSGSMRGAFLQSYVYLVKDLDPRMMSYFLNTLTLCLCAFALLAGFIQRATHRYKFLQIFGLSIRIIGLGLMIKNKGANASIGELVAVQILIGAGGAFSVVGSRVGSQASVPHEDLAMVISLLSLWTKLGGSVGTAIATGIWTNTMPDNLRKSLPDLPQAKLDSIYGNIVSARKTYPFGDPVRAGIVEAYGKTTQPTFILALCISFVSLAVGLWVPAFHLGRTHNAVDEKGVDGSPLADPKNHGDKKQSWWMRFY